MASGTINVTFSVTMRWWVQPYLWLCIAFCWSIAPFLDDEDDLGAFIDRQSQFIAAHGLKIMVEPRDSGKRPTGRKPDRASGTFVRPPEGQRAAASGAAREAKQK